jgi:hypothetical protein
MLAHEKCHFRFIVQLRNEFRKTIYMDVKAMNGLLW